MISSQTYSSLCQLSGASLFLRETSTLQTCEREHTLEMFLRPISSEIHWPTKAAFERSTPVS